MPDEFILSEKLESTASPMTVGFEEDTAIVFGVGSISQNGLTARAAAVIIASSKIVVVVIVFGTQAVLSIDVATEIIADTVTILFLSAKVSCMVIGTLITQMWACRRQLPVLY